MPIVKTKLTKRLAVTLCTMLLLCAALPVCAFADDVHIFTAYQPFMYFEKYDGVWGDLGTPPHSVVETGQPAYCLQMSMESPYGDGYDATDGSQYYTPTILNGLKAILAHGYPASTGGFTDNEAQYATANAIRFFLAENGIQEMPYYLQDTSNARAKPGYEALFAWCLELLEYSRHPDTNHSIRFSNTDLTLEANEQNYSFGGDVRVTFTGLTGGYTLDSSAFPTGTSITGYTGNSGDTLHISIPEEYEERAYTLSASGIYDSTEAVLFFYAPTTYGQQRVVTCTIDMQSTLVDASMTVRTPKAPIRTGNIELYKVDENGDAVPGACFVLYDSDGNVVEGGKTDSHGKLVFYDLPLGEYYYAETETLRHLVLDPALYPVTITEGGQTVSMTAENEFARGNVSVLKVNEETGEPMPGVHFQLKDSGGNLVAEGDTPEDGTLTFSGLLLGSYTLQETATREGFVLDTTPIPVEVAEHGQTVEISMANTPIRGNLKIVKHDAYEDTPLSGAGFRLFDSGGHQITEGYTDANGELIFESLLYGSYQYQEFCPPKGYKLDDTVYPFSITEHGVTITQERDNLRRPGTLEVKKQDQNGKPLAGATFLLEYSTDNGASWTAVFSRNGNDVQAGGCTSSGLSDGQLSTGDSGSVTFSGLRADSAILYRLTETQAPVGHSLLGSPLYVGTLPVEISGEAEDSETVDGVTYCYTLYVTATDDPIFRIPETGGAGFAWLPLFMGFMTMPYIITKRKTIDEDAAEIVRLIFYKYVYEGFGAQRLCKYLAEMNIYKEDGRNFPNTSINRIIKNELYTGVIHNGEAKSEVIPELQIVERETYERAQTIMQDRVTHHNSIPLNLKSGSLLVGNIFCGHCGNRLTLTTSGRTRKGRDGQIHFEARPRYGCHYKQRHPGECDGQSGYGVHTLDGIVDQIIRRQLERIKTSPNNDIITEQHQKAVDLAEARLRIAKSQVAEKQREITDYQNEAIRVIRGESKFSDELLDSLVKRAKSELKVLTEAVNTAQEELDTLQAGMEREIEEYDRLVSWAEIYDTCSFESKKMFVSQFVKSVRVYRDYDLEIEFNVSFDEFKEFRRTGQSGDRSA